MPLSRRIRGLGCDLARCREPVHHRGHACPGHQIRRRREEDGTSGSPVRSGRPDLGRLRRPRRRHHRGRQAARHAVGVHAGAVDPDFKACMVSDSGGFDDKSFNQTSHDGLENAEDRPRHPDRRGRVAVRLASTPTTSTRWSKQDCNQITTVGFLLGDATEAAAKKNTDIDFAIVDFALRRSRPDEPQGPDLQHRRAVVPRRLPRRGRCPRPASSAPSVASTSRP